MALVAAVREGINPATQTYASGPITLAPQWGDVTINCYGGHCRGGSPNLITGTLTSDNTVYIRLALDLGPKKVVKAAKDLGITSRLNGYPSETLGGLERCCSPLEMANAYATIVDGGWRNTPKAITEVRFPDGKVEDLSKPDRKKVFDEAAMYEVTKILEMNISKPGTGGRAKTGCPVGGKTGTTDQNSDAWFVGFSPRLATSTWVGFPQGRIPMGPIFHGANVDGGTYPAQIWGEYMKMAARGFCGHFKKPSKPFKVRQFKSKSRPQVPVQPVAPAPSAAELAAQAKKAQEQAQADHGAVRPGTGAPTPTPKPAPQTGGNGYDPGAYNPDVYDNPPQQELPPDPGAPP
jgi:penicillin-binding protein 1A